MINSKELQTDNKAVLPLHLGFIVDGNRRWARAHHMPTQAGHKRGFDVLWDMAFAAQTRGIKYLSAFIFSTENWQRSEQEVSYLMKLFISAFDNKFKQAIENNFRIIFLGERTRLAPEILDKIDRAERESSSNTGTTLALCFNYGGHNEIVDAAKNIARRVLRGQITIDAIDNLTSDQLRAEMYHPELPDVDMLVRTSGEQRLSGFQLWRAAYAELMFIEKFWPDMTEADLDDILVEFSHRQRRFGK